MARRQKGLVVKIGDRWFVRYWEKRNLRGKLVRKRASQCLGPATSNGSKPPAHILAEAGLHMAQVNAGVFEPERVVTVEDFVERVYLPWIRENKKPSTVKGYLDIWQLHLRPRAGKLWLKQVRTHHVQAWLTDIAKEGLSRNTLKHIKSATSAIFTLAKQQDYFRGENPARDTSISPKAPAPAETYAYGIDETDAILATLPEPIATAFAVAAYAGLRLGEIQGLRWEDYRHGQLYVTRAIWNGRVGLPKTSEACAPVPVIPRLVELLEIHRLTTGNPMTGPVFRTVLGKPMALASTTHRLILPALNRCVHCGQPEIGHKAAHRYERDARLPEWHGWHAARRGLGSNLYAIGVAPKVIQAVLRHANVATTMTYYVKTQDEAVRSAMSALEGAISLPQRSAKSSRVALVSELVQ